MAAITGHAVGDDFDITRTVTGLPEGTTVTKAWLMVKRSTNDPDASAVIPKTITTVAVDGTGRVTNNDDGTAELLFQIRAADESQVTAGKTYVYGIKVKLSNDLSDTLETGTFVLDPSIVHSTS